MRRSLRKKRRAGRRRADPARGLSRVAFVAHTIYRMLEFSYPRFYRCTEWIRFTRIEVDCVEEKGIPKIEKFSSYRDKVFSQIKNLILDGTLKAGESLQERDLASALGVSRTPVREALKLLEHEGWVRTIPWKGVFVREFTLDDVKDIIELRIAIETFVVRQITRTIPDSVIEDLMAELRRARTLAEQGKFTETIEIDGRFHFELAQQLGNDKITSLLETLRDQIIFWGIRALRTGDAAKEIHAEHLRILETLQGRDASAAAEAMEVHLRNVLATVAQAQKDG